MTFRRVLRSDPWRVEVQESAGSEQWMPLLDDVEFASTQTVETELELLPVGVEPRDGLVLLPVRPRSFRDFMVFEKHAIDAARGMVHRFLPGAARVLGLTEKVTRRPAKRYHPSELWYQQPIYYMSNALTFVPSGTKIAPPAYTSAIDYELEIGVILKDELFNATPAEAEAAIGAYFLLNDFSARDKQLAEMRSGFGPQKSKHFFSSMAATAVLAKEVVDVRALKGRVLINGAPVSEPTAASMRWTPGEMLAHASSSERLFPGEVFGTGTLPGGSGMETGNWLKRGDVLELAVDGIGRLEHEIL